MRIVASRRLPMLAAFAVAAFSAPVVGATAPAAVASGTVSITGADATSVTDCRNQTPGRQINRCDARADGGSVKLQDVDIYFQGSSADVQMNGGTVDMISVGGGSATAGAICINAPGQAQRQTNICRAKARGGKVGLRNVQIVVHHSDGSTTTRRRDLVAVKTPLFQNAVCTGSLVSNCNAYGDGADVFVPNVTMVNHATNETHTNVNVLVRGGDATAMVFCGNFASTPPVQINLCSATANGGDATLQNVRMHVYD